MLDLNLYNEKIEIAWCPGCGNFGILKACKQALAELEIKPEQLLVVSGIGQSGKFPHYLKCNAFNGIHGRTLPVATAARLANHDLTVVAEAGDGDCYGEGGNHLLAAWRRNPKVTLVVHNNQVYALTKGQASPTTDEGYQTLLQPEGVRVPPLHALALAVAQDCSWVGRGFAGNVAHLTALYKDALTHKGFALLEVLQPCVTFNKVNTFKWYMDRVYEVDQEPDYDPGNELWAYQKAKEWGERIPIGVIYRHTRPLLEGQHPALGSGPLVRQKPERPIKELLAEFY
jgi:2-oxoglutarate/2-oxoacid ferredoxin oxidoreductase subunit beta